MTQQQYDDMMEKLIETFNTVYNTEPSNENASLINKKANTLVNITKICIQTEIVRRSADRVRNRITENISRIEGGSIKDVTDEE